MISEQQLIARMKSLKAEVLHRWIELGLIEPHRDAGGFQFDDLDEARIALVCDLHYRMGLEHESLPVVLSLVDQLHQTRHSLRAITAAVAEQPDEVRVAITTRTRIVLGRASSGKD
jgi:chaperone modulatory protein CbpM